MISGYERMDVWRVSHELARRLFKFSKQFPPDEKFGITAQLRRASLAIPTNIAEGSARLHPKEYLQFCSISRGSLAETRYLLRFIHDLGWINPQDYSDFVASYERVGQMLNSLMAYLQGRKQHKRPIRG